MQQRGENESSEKVIFLFPSMKKEEKGGESQSYLG